MMNRKKIITMVLVTLLLAVSILGCHKKEAEPKKKESVKQETVEKEEEKEVKEKEEVKEQIQPYAPGIRTESTYESSWMKMKFTLPKGFIMATDEDIQMMQEGSQQIFEEDEALEGIAEAAGEVVYEMAVIAPDGIGNLNMSTELLPQKSMTEQQYIEVAKNQILKATEITFQVVAENEEVMIAGQKFYALTLSTEMEGISIGQKVFVRKIDDRMVVITNSYQIGNEAPMETAIAAFQPMK